MSGWIKLHRSLVDWEWYDDDPALRLLIHLLVTVNYESKKWKGVLIDPGSRICSWETLDREIKTLSVQQIRTAMKKLENCGEVTRKSTNKFQLVSLVKWEELQSELVGDNKQTNKQVTNKQQTNNKQITTTKESKNNKEIKEKKKSLVYSKAVHDCFNSCILFFSEGLRPANQKNKDAWLDVIDKLNRIDKIKFEDIEKVVKAAREDFFWKKNFLSMRKLREKDEKNKLSYYTILNEKFKVTEEAKKSDIPNNPDMKWYRDYKRTNQEVQAAQKLWRENGYIYSNGSWNKK